MSPELGILLAGENRIESALSLAHELPATTLFLMHTGVRALGDARTPTLLDRCLDVTAGAMVAEAHGWV